MEFWQEHDRRILPEHGCGSVLQTTAPHYLAVRQCGQTDTVHRAVEVRVQGFVVIADGRE